jgi:Na+/H+ antiporter
MDAMHAFEAILIVLLVAVALSLLARRLNLPFPPLLALGGAATAFLPHAPQIRLDPELALALFVAPVLLDAAFDSSPRDLKRNALPIGFLTVVAVGLTVVGVALAARGLQPDLPWAAAIALGAIVAPPDAAATTAVLRTVPAPQRIRTILEGESLFNDATSLLVYRLAVTAVASGLALSWPVAAAMAWALLGSLVLGALGGWIFARLTAPLTDAPSAIILQFIATFGVWIAAERLGLSAIITIVVYGMVAARVSARRVSGLVRAPTYAVWETVVFALNASAFALVGLQIGPIWEGLAPHERATYAGFALIILLVAVAVRLVWVMTYNTAVLLKNRLIGPNLRKGVTMPNTRGGLVIAWAGMRGVVSLAAAYALPEGFPHRELLLLAAFAVVMGTLVVQGLTLGPLLKLLRLEDDGMVETETHKAREAVSRAAIARLKGEAGPAAQELLKEYRRRLRQVRQGADGERPELEIDRLRLKTLEAKREALFRLRSEGEIGEAAYYQIEEELDRQELSLSPVQR